MCRGLKVLPGYNDLASRNPALRLAPSNNGLDLALPDGELVDYKILALRHFQIFAFHVVVVLLASLRGGGVGWQAVRTSSGSCRQGRGCPVLLPDGRRCNHTANAFSRAERLVGNRPSAL